MAPRFRRAKTVRCRLCKGQLKVKPKGPCRSTAEGADSGRTSDADTAA